jgi:phosphoserine phosphatase
MTPTIGIDFDNTIVSYDELMCRAALERGLIGDAGDRTKRAVRDRIRERPDGAIEWQKLQALVYGPLMSGARPTDGVEAFIRWCRDAGMAVCIVSHKTEYANYDATRTNLRDAALAWMAAHRFFEPDGLTLTRGSVYFESTRADKIARIGKLGCSHFVDDLEEVFLEPAFPADVHKILYAPDRTRVSSNGAIVVPSWQALREYFLDSRA